MPTRGSLHPGSSGRQTLLPLSTTLAPQHSHHSTRAHQQQPFHLSNTMLHPACRLNIQRALKTGTASLLGRGAGERNFYNRSKEVAQLSRHLNNEPRFLVLLGPPSSGKTALTQYVTSRRRTDNTPEFHSLTIDLRSMDCLQGSFLRALVNGCLDPKAPTSFWSDLLPRLKISHQDLLIRSRHDVDRSSNMAGEIFEQMGKNLRPWSGWHGERPPVLVIEEANAFKDMHDDVITTFLRFVVQMTKQEEKLHVIFTSSDSFFESWLQKHVDSTHFQTKVVGDLSREEAHQYFLHLVESHPNLSEENKDRLRSVPFDIPFKMTGGRISFIKQYINQVDVSGYFENPLDFEPVQLAMTTMVGDFLGKAKTYGEKEAMAVCKLLASSPGYLSYHKLSKDLGNSVVDEMLGRNFLHLRPQSSFSRDLIPPPSEAVVTPRGTPARIAMEEISRRLEMEEKSNQKDQSN
ncbi:hypothetical protein MJO29_013143 [Puccinia striiformis f. sp. tritici]|nr:hypothetical protein MJO29_013143 [Puccinia striiformis f. sp. tritici]